MSKVKLGKDIPLLPSTINPITEEHLKELIEALKKYDFKNFSTLLVTDHWKLQIAPMGEGLFTLAFHYAVASPRLTREDIKRFVDSEETFKKAAKEIKKEL